MAAKAQAKGSPKASFWRQRGTVRHRIEATLGGRDYVFRSRLELGIGKSLDQRGVAFDYETIKVAYVVPARDAKYTPDFILPNGIIVEAKGIFDAEDRAKLILVREQHPELDIRLVFQRATTAIYPGSPTTLGAWAEKHGFIYANKDVPDEWLAEPPRRQCRRPGRGPYVTMRRPRRGW